jgi:hypothetical protein
MSSTFKVAAGTIGNSITNEISLGSMGYIAGANAVALGVRGYRASAGTDWTTTAIGLGMDVDNTVRAGAHLWLHANGNVGIGATAPNAKLTIANNVATSFLDNYSEYQLMIHDGGSAAGSYGLGINGNTMVLNSGGGTFRFDNNAASTLATIDGTGLGVGRTAGTKLDVEGIGRFLSPNTSTTGGVVIRDAAANPNAAYLQFVNNGNTVQYGYVQGLAAGGLNLDGGNVGIGDTTPSTKLDVNGEITSQSANAFRMVQGSYGAFWRNDGSDTYLLLTASADQYGSWNSLRPFHVANATGLVSMDNNVILPSDNLQVCNGGACASSQNGVGTITSERAIVAEEATLATTGSITVNWDDGNQQRVSGSTGNMTFNFSNATAGQTLRLVVCYGGAHTITWTPTIRWAGGSAPTPTSTNAKCDVFSFIYTGSEYLGQPSLNF